MKRHQDDAFQQAPEDGIEVLPRSGGTYCVLNRINGKRYVGQARDIYRRCKLHRSELRLGLSANMLMRRDAEVNGFDAFYFALQLDAGADAGLPSTSNQIELWWTIQLLAHDESRGYNLEAGRFRTSGALFRDRERKLMRPNSRKYELLAGVDMYDPIHPEILGTWVRGS